jgi:endonuclease/exonuclease/phosphatase (EEP) superfamily protein YafD
VRYLQQLVLQQSAHFPSAHFAQELQEDLQQLLQALALSVAMALERQKPATTASRAPALISVERDFIFWCGSAQESFPVPQGDSPQTTKSPKENKKTFSKHAGECFFDGIL